MSRKCGEPPLSPWWDESKASMTKTLLGEELWIQTSRLLLHAAARMHDDDGRVLLLLVEVGRQIKVAAMPICGS